MTTVDPSNGAGHSPVRHTHRVGRRMSLAVCLAVATVSSCTLPPSAAATPSSPRSEPSVAEATQSPPAATALPTTVPACLSASAIAALAETADATMRESGASGSIDGAHAAAAPLATLLRQLLPGDTEGPPDGPLAALITRSGTSAAELDSVALGGLTSWTRPRDRYDQWREVLAAWRPDRNTMPELPSHLLRALGWATLIARSDDLVAARGLAAIHGTIHTHRARSGADGRRASPGPLSLILRPASTTGPKSSRIRPDIPGIRSEAASGPRLPRRDGPTILPHRGAAVIDLRHLAIRTAPAHVIALTATASYLAQLLGILQEWPLWSIGLVTLLPWLPLATREVAWSYRHYGWLALFYVLVITQGGHLIEHAAQMIQIHALDLSGSRARGIFGALDTEWVHWAWNTIVLVAVAALTWRFRSNRWLWVALVVAVWHEIEHVAIMATYLSTGRVGGPGLLSQRGLIMGGLPIKRPDLHFWYVVLSTLPIFAAFLVQLRHTYSQWLALALPSADRTTLSELTSKLRVVRIAAGGEVFAAGDIADTFYVVSSGECAAVSRDGGGAEVELRRMGPGEHFGEIGVLESGRRTAAVRALTDTELLAVSWRDLRALLETSSGAMADITGVARARLAETAP